MAQVMAKLYPSAMKPGSSFDETGVSRAAHVHPSARLEPGVVVDPGAVIGQGAEIGAGTVIGANAVIGPDVRIGRNGAIGATTTIIAALIGDRVIIHPGVHIGQDGFGFALGARGHLKVPQVGRVIIQDDVEIGAGVTIDRGANRDTVIGEGAKIDNLVMVAHNVVIGRHAVLVSQSGVSGSSVIGDFAALGGQAGIAGHLKIGAGAQVAAAAGVMTDIPRGRTLGRGPCEADPRILPRGGGGEEARRRPRRHARHGRAMILGRDGIRFARGYPHAAAAPRERRSTPCGAGGRTRVLRRGSMRSHRGLATQKGGTE